MHSLMAEDKIMRNRLLILAVMVFMLGAVGCKVVPDDPADYDVKFLKGEMSHVVVSFPLLKQVVVSDCDYYELARDYLSDFEIKATLAFNTDLSIESFLPICGVTTLADLPAIECKIFLSHNRINVDQNFSVKLTATFDGHSKPFFLEEEYRTPTLIVQVKTDLEKCEEMAAGIQDSHVTDHRLSAVCIALCDEDPTRSFCKPVDIADDSGSDEEIILVDTVDKETPAEVGENMLGYGGGSCALMPTEAGQGIAGILFMMISLVPAVLRRGLK